MQNLPETFLIEMLQKALEARWAHLEPPYQGGLRLFNGHTEGLPGVVVESYAQTLLIHASSGPENQTAQSHAAVLETIQSFYLDHLPWLESVLVKIRSSSDAALRRGQVVNGGSPARQLEENGVIYALDLQMNQDASFYLDTAGLRTWLKEHAAGWRVLNTFAYTGSLGVAALAGGAKYVMQTDRSARFLSLARRSAMLNHLDLGKMPLRTADFFSQIAALKKSRALFDCVILDPPFFSSTAKGRVDQQLETGRLINKVRPLIQDGGWLVAINNALFLSGENYLAQVQALCADGYLDIAEIMPVPEHITGHFKPGDHPNPGLPANPAPFNHPTKILLLRVHRKSS